MCLQRLIKNVMKPSTKEGKGALWQDKLRQINGWNQAQLAIRPYLCLLPPPHLDIIYIYICSPPHSSWQTHIYPTQIQSSCHKSNYAHLQQRAFSLSVHICARIAFLHLSLFPSLTLFSAAGLRVNIWGSVAALEHFKENRALLWTWPLIHRSGKEAERVNKKGPQVLLLGRGVCTCITHVVRISLFTLCLYWQKYKSL